MKYMILEGFDKQDLYKGVQILVKSGWQLSGGVSIAITQAGRTLYAQALVCDARQHPFPETESTRENSESENP